MEDKERTSGDISQERWQERAIRRCHAEIAAVEAQIRGGHPDLQGLCLALADWSEELRILIGNRGPEQKSPPAAEAGRADGENEAQRLIE